MYNIGDRVVYGSYGVMSVVDIREEVFLDTPRRYYVLSPFARSGDSFTFVPTDSEALLSAMRPLLTESEIDELICESQSIRPAEWHPETRARTEKFKRIIESGDRRGMIAMIKAIRLCAARREADGKKPYISDDNLMKKAEHVLYSEISAVLGIGEDDAPKYIEEKIKALEAIR